MMSFARNSVHLILHIIIISIERWYVHFNHYYYYYIIIQRLVVDFVLQKISVEWLYIINGKLYVMHDGGWRMGSLKGVYFYWVGAGKHRIGQVANVLQTYY